MSTLAPDLTALFGCSVQAPAFCDFLSSKLGLIPPDILSSAQVKSFPDTVFIAWPLLGISFAFDPLPPYKPTHNATLADITPDSLRLAAIDIYHAAPSEGRTKASGSTVFSTCDKLLPLKLSLPSQSQREQLQLTSATSAKELVETLGEPDSKGGGSVSPVWLEWVSLKKNLFIRNKIYDGTKRLLWVSRSNWAEREDMMLGIAPKKSPGPALRSMRL